MIRRSRTAMEKVFAPKPVDQLAVVVENKLPWKCSTPKRDAHIAIIQ